MLPLHRGERLLDASEACGTIVNRATPRRPLQCLEAFDE